MHLHLDLVGGISGDMFIGAMLDVFPELGEHLTEQLSLAGFEHMVSLEFDGFNDGVLTGCRFNVSAQADAHGHHHRHYSEIKTILTDSALEVKTKDIALAIFHIIAVAEAQIHDKPVDKIAFHEVGAWDSIADVVCASYLIAHCGLTSSSVSNLPLGGGQVKTDHGMLPVPAPATALILSGFDFVDDGISGERITPTGAAILKYLTPGAKPAGQLGRQGFGFGTKKFPGISNVLRILQFETHPNLPGQSEACQTQAWQTETVTQLEFELDDQTSEEIATAIDALRLHPAVLDVVQYNVVGKKNRLSHSLRVLCSSADDVVECCFELTTTLGVRQSTVTRSILHREPGRVEIAGNAYRTKLAHRPGGNTVKTEMDDLSNTTNSSQQRQIRRQIEADGKLPS